MITIMRHRKQQLQTTAQHRQRTGIGPAGCWVARLTRGLHVLAVKEGGSDRRHDYKDHAEDREPAAALICRNDAAAVEGGLSLIPIGGCLVDTTGSRTRKSATVFVAPVRRDARPILDCRLNFVLRNLQPLAVLQR